jgi:hypothetical protein
VTAWHRRRPDSAALSRVDVDPGGECFNITADLVDSVRTAESCVVVRVVTV